MQQGKLKSHEKPYSRWQSSLLIKNVIFNWYTMHISPTKHLTDSFHEAQSFLRRKQIVRKFPTFQGTKMFLNMFTTAWHLAISWATWIKVMSSHIISFKIHPNIILLPMPSSPKQSLSLGFPTNTLYTLLLFPMHDTHLPFLELVTWISDHRHSTLGSNKYLPQYRFQISSNYDLPVKRLSYILILLWSIYVYLNQCQSNWM